MGGLNDELKMHLVKWDKVCSPIDEGGLGIRNVMRFNQVLLGKWLWRFAHEEGAWWRSILVAKYGADWGGWHSGEIPSPHGVGIWKFICKGWQTFRSHFHFDPGEGSKIRFGMMFGVGIEPLKRHFLVCSSLLVPRKRPLDNVGWSNGN